MSPFLSFISSTAFFEGICAPIFMNLSINHWNFSICNKDRQFSIRIRVDFLSCFDPLLRPIKQKLQPQGVFLCFLRKNSPEKWKSQLILRPSGIFELSSIRSCDFISYSYIKVMHYSNFDKNLLIIFFANFYANCLYFKEVSSA